MHAIHALCSTLLVGAGLLVYDTVRGDPAPPALSPQLTTAADDTAEAVYALRQAFETRLDDLETRLTHLEREPREPTRSPAVPRPRVTHTTNGPAPTVSPAGEIDRFRALLARVRRLERHEQDADEVQP